MHINDLLKIAVERKASDLHLKVGALPGHPRRRDADAPDRHAPAHAGRHDRDGVLDHVRAPEGEVQEQLRDRHRLLGARTSGRFRCNIFQQRGTVGLVLRVIPARILTIRELLLPPVLEKICQEQRGLVLCTGTTGSGKSTSLAAMIDHINATRNEHIMTIEDPIEFLHRDKKSIVNQREVEVDTKGFSLALRSALRQDPDVILVGEMRDYETIETALTAAETGHLVFSTLHTLDATETINRIIAVFPPHQQKQIRLQLGAVLKAVISLRLMPRADGLGRVPAVEVLIRTATSASASRTRRRPSSSRTRSRPAPRSTGCRPSTSRSTALQVGPDHARGGPEARDEPERVQAQDPGHPVDLRHRARGDGRRARGAGGLQPDGRGIALRLLEPAASGTRTEKRGGDDVPERRAAARAGFRRGGARAGAAPADVRRAGPRGARAGPRASAGSRRTAVGEAAAASRPRAGSTTSRPRGRSSASGRRGMAAARIERELAARGFGARRSPRRSRRRWRGAGRRGARRARSSGSGSARAAPRAAAAAAAGVARADAARFSRPEGFLTIIRSCHEID